MLTQGLFKPPCMGLHPPGGLRGTPACSKTTPSTCTWNSGWPSASSPGSAPRASSTTTCRAPASPRPATRFPASSSSDGSALYGRRAERLHEEIVPLAARWVEPARRSDPLRAYAREAETRTLQLLEWSLAGRPEWTPHQVIQAKLLATAPRDVDELLPQLEPRAGEIAELATRRLRERGEREARDLKETLRRQRERIVEELDRHEGQYAQITLDFDEDERRQLQTNMRYWRTRLDQFDRDLKREPGRIRAFYEVQAKRVEPVGLVYLWPETN